MYISLYSMNVTFQKTINILNFETLTETLYYFISITSDIIKLLHIIARLYYDLLIQIRI